MCDDRKGGRFDLKRQCNVLCRESLDVWVDRACDAGSTCHVKRNADTGRHVPNALRTNFIVRHGNLRQLAISPTISLSKTWVSAAQSSWSFFIESSSGYLISSSVLEDRKSTRLN